MPGGGGDTHVILGGATDVAALALNALPAVGLHCCHHYGSELEARRMPCGEEASESGAGHGAKRRDLLDCDSRGMLGSQEPLGNWCWVLAVVALAPWVGST